MTNAEGSPVLVESDVYEIGNVTFVRARVHFVHPEAGARILEHTIF